MPNRFLTYSLLAAGLMLPITPTATAEPIPAPEPTPAPGAPLEPASTECQNGEVMQDGNCVPNMAPVATTVPEPAQVPQRNTQSETTSTTSGLGANEVPNINGYPCTGDFQSMVCIAQGEADLPVVQPRSTLSSSP